MTPPRILGAVSLAIGLVLLVIGLQSSNSMADQVSNTITGRFTDATTWYIVAGLGLGVFGVLLATMGGRSATK